uniref:Uncharacterized protein n=1 Tax=Molossus molossus TaxID=27622 RepID=A0A7J8F8X7_MOLMO|nr:hypothetical protein HJG59_008517 [Molossus molossus]
MGKNIYKEPLSAFDRPQHHVLRNLYCALYGVPPLLTGCCSQIPSRSANARHCGACSKRVPGSDCIGSRNVRLESLRDPTCSILASQILMDIWDFMFLNTEESLSCEGGRGRGVA